MQERVCAIMAGGSGERLWPLSRPGRPKQLLEISRNDRTMVMDAVERVRPLFKEQNLILATSAELRQPMLAAGNFSETSVFSEPARRNTLGAQCWILANLIALGKSDATLAILTADHVIGEEAKFRESLNTCMEIAESEGSIVTLGVVPTRPETGYGYIEEDRSRPVRSQSGREAFRTLSFREKPSVDTAEAFLEEGNFLWNSGMFFFTIPAFLLELEKAQPHAYEATLRIASALEKGELLQATQAFEQLPNLSIDYAVMERSDSVTVLRADFPWDDFGAWDALERIRPLDGAHNVSEGDVLMVDSRSSIVLNKHSSLRIGVLGLTDIIVIACDEAVLVCHKRDAQSVRVLAKLDEKAT